MATNIDSIILRGQQRASYYLWNLSDVDLNSTEVVDFLQDELTLVSIEIYNSLALRDFAAINFWFEELLAISICYRLKLSEFEND